MSGERDSETDTELSPAAPPLPTPVPNAPPPAPEIGPPPAAAREAKPLGPPVEPAHIPPAPQTAPMPPEPAPPPAARRKPIPQPPASGSSSASFGLDAEPETAHGNRQVAFSQGGIARRKPSGFWRILFQRRREPSERGPATPGELLAEREQQRRKMPSWLVSFVFHLAALLILALIPLGQLASGPLTLILGPASPAGIADFALTTDEPAQQLDAPLQEQVLISENSISTTELLDVEMPELELEQTPDASTAAETIQSLEIPYGISNGLAGRSGQLKSALLSKFGGTAETEEAVELGLKWLEKNQKSNGSWSLVGPYSLGGTSENTTAATAMALNAFLGAGYTHQAGKYREAVKLGLAYLVRRQDKDGFFAEREPSRQQMYAQAIATIAVTEAYGMSGDSDLRIAAQRALGFAEWSQSKLKGWRYEPREDADLSVTGWFVMALETGKMAGLAVDEEKLQSVSEFLDSVAYEEDSRYAYNDFEPPSLSMTAEGLLCRIYLGWPRTHPALLRAIRDDLLPNAPRAEDFEISVYYWYYATQVLHHVGGTAWVDWNRQMKRVLPALQIKEGGEAGSWDPSNDVFGASGGRLYTTCLNLYCLEVYYRHLSIYDLP